MTLIVVVVLAAGVGVILAVGGPLSAYFGFGDARLLVCGVVTMLLQATTIMPLAMMQARFESVSYVCATVGMALCQITCAIVTVAGLGWGAWGVIGGLALTHATFGSVLTLRELWRGSFRPDPAPNGALGVSPCP